MWELYPSQQGPTLSTLLRTSFGRAHRVTGEIWSWVTRTVTTPRGPVVPKDDKGTQLMPSGTASFGATILCVERLEAKLDA